MAKILYLVIPCYNEEEVLADTAGKLDKKMKELMASVINGDNTNSTGYAYYMDGYSLIGKTGTAQKVGSDGRYMYGNYVLSFIGFMPANDPEYVIYIALDHPTGVTQYGGVVSAPIARNVLKDIISIYNIPESKDGIPKSYRWDDIVYVTVPDIVGKTKKEAKVLLKDFNVEFVGDGDKVFTSSPSSGMKVKMGSTIKVLLN